MKKIISDTLKQSDKENRKLSKEIRELLWDGSINGISSLVKEKLVGKRKARSAALKKLSGYFGDHAKFQYKTFRDKNRASTGGKK